MSEIHTKILDDYFEKGLSLEILKAMYGRSTVQISRLVKEATKDGRTRAQQPKDRRGSVGCEPLSPPHKRLGMKFRHWRSLKKMTPREAAEKIGVSVNRYSSIEAGIHHITLLEMTFLFERVGWSFYDMMTVFDKDDITTIGTP